MTKQHISILLVLMMVITPVASAFNHCSGIGMRGELTECQRVTTVSVLVDKATTSIHMDMLKKQNHADGQCHTSNNCAFHVCDGFGMSSPISSVNAIVSNSNYFTSHYSSLYSTALSAEIRPSILIF